MSTPTNGLIGAGLLGAAIAGRLAAAGRRLTVYDKDATRYRHLPPNTTTAPDPNGVFAAADTIIFSLPNSSIVRAALDSVSATLRTTRLIIDTTTGSPDDAVSTAALLRRSNVTYVDATVAGSSAQLGDGEAAMFLGAAEGQIAELDDIVRILTKKPFYLGAVGNGAKFKLVHNLILGLNRATLAEGLRLAEVMGFQPLDALQILEQTPAATTVMKSKGQKIATRDYDPQAMLSQHLKDVDLILQQAMALNAPTPLSDVHRTILDRAVKRGFGTADNSAVIEGLDK